MNADSTSATASSRTPSDLKPVEIIRAETNFLRFPLFALHTRGLTERDAIECVGRKRINGRLHEFEFSIYRNTRYCHPGRLSRSVHFALLSFMQEQGYPFKNPIVWTWRELARRMEISCSGRTVEDIKGAIRSSAGVLVTTNDALTAAIGTTRGLLPSDEHGYQLYDAYRFKNDLRQDGTIIDRNAVWLSDWYPSRFHKGYVAWTEGREIITDRGDGVEETEGNGFGCVLLRTEVLADAVFTCRQSPHLDFDPAFYERIKSAGLVKLCWDVECEHLDARDETRE